jgi:predicted ATP-grasp superfamily ATP-dependent carboligase
LLWDGEHRVNRPAAGARHILTPMVERPGVLLAVDESPASLAAARGLEAGGYRVHVALTRDDTYVARSRAVASVERLRHPESQPDEFVAELADVVARLGVALVLPATESTLRALTGREAAFGDGVKVGTSPPETLDAATDKLVFQRFSDEAGLETIPTFEVSAADVDERASELSFPAVAKPPRTIERADDGTLLSMEVTHLEGLDDLRRLLDAAPSRRWLVQPRVDGMLAAIGGVSWRGDVVSAAHQVSPRIWPVDSGITAYGITVPPHREREAGVARLLGLIGWSGIFGVQFLVSRDHAYAIDLNPRIYGSIALAIAAGHNLPAIWADLLLGRRPAVGDYRCGVRYRVEEDDVRALAAAFWRGRRREALAGLLPRPNTVHAVFSARDPAPTMASVAKAWARVASRGAA